MTTPASTSPATSARFCPECGQQLRPNYRFCIRCGRLHPFQAGARPPGEAGAAPSTPMPPAWEPQPDIVIDQPGTVAVPWEGSRPVQQSPAAPPAADQPAQPVWSVPGPVVEQPRLVPQAPAILAPAIFAPAARVAAPLEVEQPEPEGNPLGGWLFSIVTGAYAVATVAVANVILWVVSFCLAAAYDWIGSSGWFIAAVLVILVFLVSLGAPVLIILGVLGAIAGGIAGGLVGAGIGLVCLLGYLLGSLYKPLRPLLMYPSAAGLAVLLYSQLGIYRQFLQDLPYSVWIDYLNFLMAAVAGLVVAWGFLAKPVELSPEESEANWKSTKDILGAPWRFYRRVGGWASDAYEKDKEDYTFRGALGMKKPEEQEQKKVSDELQRGMWDSQNWAEVRRQKRMEREQKEKVEKMVAEQLRKRG